MGMVQSVLRICSVYAKEIAAQALCVSSHTLYTCGVIYLVTFYVKDAKLQ
jgi:hypothetical protein